MIDKVNAKSAPAKLRGSCHCGSIHYEIHGELGPIVCCHCSQCRKSQGTAFATNAPVKTSDFHFVSGEEDLRQFQTSPDKVRAFCQQCGSPIYSQLIKKPDVLRLRIGTLDTEIDAKPTAHIYVDSKAEWHEINDGLPQFSEREPR
ncbi:MAG: GFA family protein [Pseudomonadota bacterium]